MDLATIIGGHGLRTQPIDATHALNRSAGVSYSNVFLGLSLSRLATLFSCACDSQTHLLYAVAHEYADNRIDAVPGPER